MATEITDEQTQEVEIPEDYKAFVAFRDAESSPTKTPAPSDSKSAPSDPDESDEDESGQIAEESDTEEDSEQEDDDTQEEDKEIDDNEIEDKAPVAKGKETRLAKRMRELTGEIKALKSQLKGHDLPEDDEEATAEVVSAPEPVAAVAKLARPMLKDFEDNDESSAWDQYEAAIDAYGEANLKAQLTAALAAQRTTLDNEHAKATAQADWNKAASRYPDYNEVVGDKVRISAAMEAIMRMDPEKGTALAYYMGGHPEESLRIATATLASDEKQWPNALARAGMELGAIQAKLTAPGKPALVKGTPVKATPAPSPTKKLTAANRPPPQIRGGTEQPKLDLLSDDGASNYKKWNAAREAQIRKGR